MSTELFFSLTIFILILGVPGIFYSFERRKVYPIVLVGLSFFFIGGWGFSQLTDSPPPRNDPALEAIGVYVPMETAPSFEGAFEIVLRFFSSLGLIVAGGFAIVLAISRSERNRLRRETRSRTQRPYA